MLLVGPLACVDFIVDVLFCMFSSGQQTGALAGGTNFVRDWSGNDMDALLMRFCRSVESAGVCLVAKNVRFPA